MDVLADLAKRSDAGKPIQIALIGAGEMGTDIVTQVALMRGLNIAVLADIDLQRCRDAIAISGRAEASARVCDSARSIELAVESGLTALCQDGLLACTCDLVDVIIDATGNPSIGADLAVTAMDHGKHVVMMNVEADVTIGSWLARRAETAGVVYSLGAGDEPSAAMEIVNFARSLGYPIIAAGKGKNNPLKFDAVPEEYAAEAARRHMNPRMLVEFVDGSKTMIEMVALANATGLVPDRPGMHGPAATLDQLCDVFRPLRDGGLLSREGVVDYTVGQGVAPGVFVVIKAPHPRIDERMRDLKMGNGPYYTLYRPYHLTSLEVPLTAASVALYRTGHMRPLDVPVAEAAALCKNDLSPGTKLGKIGEAHYRGWAVEAAMAQREAMLPIGLAERAVVTRPIKAGEYLTYQNCRPDETLAIVRLRREQDRALGREPELVAAETQLEPGYGRI